MTAAALPVPAETGRQRDLAVAWMNRGHDHLVRGTTPDLAAGLAAYGEAIALLEPLVAAAPAERGWANSLGAARLNRGVLLHRAHGTARADAALADFARAIALLSGLADDRAPWPRRNLAGAHLNRASLLLDLGRAGEARADASTALRLSVPAEDADLVDADLALKARRAACDAIGQLLVAPGADQDALAHEASDLVDDALALARRWIARGAPHPRELAHRLFHFGAQLYRLHQPHFLAEFLLEHLAAAGPDRDLARLALAQIDAALVERPGEPFLVVGDPASERRLLTARALVAARARIAALAA